MILISVLSRKLDTFLSSQILTNRRSFRSIFQLLVVSSLLQSLQCTDSYQLRAQDVCAICECLKGQGGPRGDQLEVSIDCSERQLKDLPVDWPSNITAADDLADARLVASFSGNPFGILKKLPETRSKNVSLSFRHCGLTELVSAAFLDIPYLEELDLCFNNLTTESLHGDVLRGLYDTRRYEPLPLRVLLLSHNNLQNGLQASALEHTPDLRKLDLSHNNMHNIEGATTKALATVTMLEVLDLSHNGISIFPENLAIVLVDLKDLNLRGNAFHTIPESLAYLGHTLQKLDVSHNPVTVLNDESFLGLNHLEFLKINNMLNLESVTSDAFTTLTSLKVLKMEKCPKLHHIDQEAFMTAYHMKFVLDMKIWRLEELYLDDGNLTSLPDYMIDWTPLKVLNLDGNPWHCSCHFALTVNAHSNATANSLARCKTPYERAGMLVKNVAKEYCLGIHTISANGTIDEPPTFTPNSTRDKIPYARHSVVAALILFAVVLATLGAALGCLGSCLRERLRRRGGSGQPIKYTNMRNSVISNA